MGRFRDDVITVSCYEGHQRRMHRPRWGQKLGKCGRDGCICFLVVIHDPQNRLVEKDPKTGFVKRLPKEMLGTLAHQSL